MAEEKDIYEELATEAPDRGDEVDDEDISNVPASSTEAEGFSAKDSDLLTTMKTLFPKVADVHLDKIASIIMLGRGFPETFQSNVYLITTALARLNRNNNDFNVILCRQQVEGLFQIGLEGKGRVEAVIVSGNTKEIAEQEAGGRL